MDIVIQSEGGDGCDWWKVEGSLLRICAGIFAPVGRRALVSPKRDFSWIDYILHDARRYHQNRYSLMLNGLKQTNAHNTNRSNDDG